MTNINDTKERGKEARGAGGKEVVVKRMGHLMGHARRQTRIISVSLKFPRCFVTPNSFLRHARMRRRKRRGEREGGEWKGGRKGGERVRGLSGGEEIATSARKDKENRSIAEKERWEERRKWGRRRGSIRRIRRWSENSNHKEVLGKEYNKNEEKKNEEDED